MIEIVVPFCNCEAEFPRCENCLKKKAKHSPGNFEDPREKANLLVKALNVPGGKVIVRNYEIDLENGEIVFLIDQKYAELALASLRKYRILPNKPNKNEVVDFTAI